MFQASRCFPTNFEPGSNASEANDGFARTPGSHREQGLIRAKRRDREDPIASSRRDLASTAGLAVTGLMRAPRRGVHAFKTGAASLEQQGAAAQAQ